MLTTYNAILKGNQLEWIEGAPTLLSPDEPVNVKVTILKPDAISVENNQGQRMADALEKLARKGTLKHLGDPVDWERTNRQDRPLPNRGL